MPTYQYACTECGEPLEQVQKFTDDPLTVCPACGGKLRKLFSSVGIVFKGSGFYRTDSRSAAAVGAKASPEGGSAASSSGSTEQSGSGASKDSSGSNGSSGSGSSGDSKGTPTAATATTKPNGSSSASDGSKSGSSKSGGSKPGGSKSAADS